jgi:hypothetical protein
LNIRQAAPVVACLKGSSTGQTLHNFVPATSPVRPLVESGHRREIITDREFRLCSKRFGGVATVPRSIAAPQQRWRDFRIAQ